MSSNFRLLAVCHITGWRPHRTLRQLAPARHTGGFALVPVLLLLLVLGGLSASAAQLALLGDRSLRANQQQGIALLAAQAALDDAVRDILGNPNPLRRAAFDALATTPATSSGWPDSACGAGALQGLCAAGTAWPHALPEQLMQTTVFGSHTDTAYPSGPGLPAQAPRYRIERLPPTLAADAAPGAPVSHGHAAEIGPQMPAAHIDAAPQPVFQITAVGFGPAAGTHTVILQRVLRLPARATPTASATP